MAKYHRVSLSGESDKWVNERDAQRAESKDDYQVMWEAMTEQQREQQLREVRAVCSQLEEALKLRDKYMKRELDREAAEESKATEHPFSPPPDPTRRPRRRASRARRPCRATAAD